MIPITQLDDLYQFGGQSVAYQTNFQCYNRYGKLVRDPQQIMYGYVYKKAFQESDNPPYIVIKLFDKYPGISYKFKISDTLLANSNLSLRFATPSEAKQLYKKLGTTNYFPDETTVKLNKLVQEHFISLLFIAGKNDLNSILSTIPKELIYIIIKFYSQVTLNEFTVNQNKELVEQRDVPSNNIWALLS